MALSLALGSLSLNAPVSRVGTSKMVATGGSKEFCYGTRAIPPALDTLPRERARTHSCSRALCARTPMLLAHD